MADTSQVREHMEVIGADGVHLGTVDAVKGDRIKLTKKDSGLGSHEGHHHYLPAGLIATIEGDTVRLSANADVALTFEEEEHPKRLWNWNRIGLGAAALGVGAAAAGAAYMYRKGGSDTGGGDDFQLRLETDETVRLISSRKVQGTKVVGIDGETLGNIESFMVDKYTGRVAYAIMSFGGTLGLGNSYFPLPWPLLDYDIDKDGYALDISKQEMANAPKFEAGNEPEFDPAYRRRVLTFYRPI